MRPSLKDCLGLNPLACPDRVLGSLLSLDSLGYIRISRKDQAEAEILPEFLPLSPPPILPYGFLLSALP